MDRNPGTMGLSQLSLSWASGLPVGEGGQSPGKSPCTSLLRLPSLPSNFEKLRGWPTCKVTGGGAGADHPEMQIPRGKLMSGGDQG